VSRQRSRQYGLVGRTLGNVTDSRSAVVAWSAGVSAAAAALAGLLATSKTPLVRYLFVFCVVVAVIAFVILLVVGFQGVALWWWARRRRLKAAAASATVEPLLGRPVRDLKDPLDLEVHPAIDAGAQTVSLPVLPTYIPRPHDRRLLDAMRRAQNSSAMVVLIGGSSTGKSRALWEALRALPGDGWRLWHPIYPGRPDAVLDGFSKGHISPRTVVWLNETQLYLNTPADYLLGEQAAAALRELLRDATRGPVLVLGTLWPEHWDVLSRRPDPVAEDRHAQARGLLAVAEQIHIPDEFTAQELQELRAAAESDPRLAMACQEAHAKVTQFLAGAFDLVSRYQTAPPAAAAVITAAMDARRLGYGSHLAEALLKDAASGYLDDNAWQTLGDDWFPAAVDYAGKPCRGVPGPLTRVRARPGERSPAEPQYELADYLDQHGTVTRRYNAPPGTLWEAAARHAGDRQDLWRLASAAQNRGRFRYAGLLYLRAVEAGDSAAALPLAALLERAGDMGGAIRYYMQAAATGSRAALFRLTVLHELAGDHEAAEESAEGSLDGSALRWLAAVREKSGDHAGAERLYQQLSGVGDIRALTGLTVLRGNAGDWAGAQQAAEQAAAWGSATALAWLAERREQAGESEGAARVHEQLADSGDPAALLKLAEIRERSGDRAGAEQIYQRISSNGDTTTLLWAAVLKERRGDLSAAERLYQWAADHGDTEAMLLLADLREQEGDVTGAADMAQRAADAGDPDALALLTGLRERVGDGPGAEHLADQAARNNDPETFAYLAAIRERAGDYASAQQLYERALDNGDTSALVSLAALRVRVGDYGGAEEMARRADDVGHTDVWERLAESSEQAGDYSRAEEMARRAVDAGHTDVWERLAESSEQAGDYSRAEEMARRAVDAGHTNAVEELAALLHRRSKWAEASKIERFGLTGDGSTSELWKLDDLLPV
jgi:hypothetical protein